MPKGHYSNRKTRFEKPPVKQVLIINKNTNELENVGDFYGYKETIKGNCAEIISFIGLKDLVYIEHYETDIYRTITIKNPKILEQIKQEIKIYINDRSLDINKTLKNINQIARG